jgi:hypothetical protein
VLKSYLYVQSADSSWVAVEWGLTELAETQLEFSQVDVALVVGIQVLVVQSVSLN